MRRLGLRRPTRPFRAILTAPVVLYRWRLGWLLGHRFLALTYRGRRTGRLRQTVLEVVRYDPTTRESVVMSAFGVTAGWYLSLQAAPPVRVHTGRLEYRPRQRILSLGETREIANAFCREHPLEAGLAPSVLRGIGAARGQRSAGPAALLASLPMVALRPDDDRFK